jgi:hypothetical protein
MSCAVNILATCKNRELMPGTLLTFHTLRVGFPTALVTVYGNGLSTEAEKAVRAAAAVAQCRYVPLRQEQHHDVWIAGLLATASGPFWVCDTDVVFHGAVEGWDWTAKQVACAGRFEPQFLEEWTGYLKSSRLHTSLLWLNAPLIHQRRIEFAARFRPGFPGEPLIEWVRQALVFRFGRPMLFDTCAQLYHALGGVAFDEGQNAQFDHLHCATYADKVKLSVNLRAAHELIYQDPTRARGMQQQQAEYYERMKPKE